MSRLVALSLLCLLGTVACSSGEGPGEPTSEDALERHRVESAAAVDLSKFSLVQALVSADRATSEAMAEAILSTSKKADKSDRRGSERDSAFAGMMIDGDPSGIECAKDGATGQMVCSLVMAIVRSSDVTGRDSGEPGVLLPTHAKLTGKLAQAVSEALPKKAEGLTGALNIECKVARGAAECDVPLKGLGITGTLKKMIEQTKENEGAAKADR